jgi:hypothetical protein
MSIVTALTACAARKREVSGLAHSLDIQPLMKFSDKLSASSRYPTNLSRPGMFRFRTDGKRADGRWGADVMVMEERKEPNMGRYPCTDALCKSNVSCTSRTPGAAAGKSETKKRDLYSELPSQYLFCAFAVETLGTFGEEALKS